MFGFKPRPKETIHAIGSALRSGSADTSQVPWQNMLTWASRILALLWLMKGLAAWGIIFGILGREEDFLSRSLEFQTFIIYFSVVDIIAAVGLWMVSSWGNVLWLIAVLSYLVLANLAQEVADASPLMMVALLLFLIAYFSLFWMVARNERL